MGNLENVLSDEEIGEDYTMLNSLNSEDFQKWLVKYRGFLKDNIQIGIIDFAISNKN